MDESLKEYYGKNYKNYHAQNPAKKLAFYKSVILSNITNDTPKTIYDIGCAFGNFLLTIDDSWKRFGSDQNQFAIEKARQTVPGIAFEAAKGIYDFSDKKQFGVITAFDVLEHINDIQTTFSAIKDLLAPDGIFIFVVPVYDGISGPIIRFLDHDATHVNRWTRQEWLNLAEQNFNVVWWTGIVRYLLPRNYYLHMPTKLFRNHTPAIIVVCKKQLILPR